MARQKQRTIRCGVMAAAAMAAALPALPLAVASVQPPPATASSGGGGDTRMLTEFGAACDGVTDDAAAFAAATAWLSTASNRSVQLPVGTCATSQTVTVGDGRQLSTTLSSGLSGGETSLPVASIAGISNGDRVVLVLDSGATHRTSVNGTPSAGSVPIAAAVPSAAGSGNVVYTGKDATYNGGGFVGYGSGATAGEFALPRTVSVIKYTGSAAPTTTLGATASTGARSLTVASIGGIAIGDPIGVTLDNARVWWTVVRETPTGTTVKIENEVPSTATSGNTVTIATNPVARIKGPIIAPVFEGILLDANSLAAVGFDVMHAHGGKFQGPRGVVAQGYTGIGFFLHSQEAYLGTAVGSTDNDFELHALSPANSKTIGLWFRGSAPGNVAFSRNRFHGGTYTMGGNDVTAAGIREEYADNNTFIKPYTAKNGASVSGAGWYRQPAYNRVTVGNNLILGGSIVGNVTDGTATGGSFPRNNVFLGYMTDDAEAIPTGSAIGVTDAAEVFTGTGGVLAQRAGTNAQAFQAYNTYTDASNGAWAFLDAGKTTANVVGLGSRSNGTGSGVLTKFKVEIDGANKLDYGVTYSGQWSVAGELYPAAGNSYALGTNGKEWSALWLADTGNLIYWRDNGRMTMQSGSLIVKDWAGTSFGLMKFGGTTSSYPGLKRFGNALAHRRADDTVATVASLTACATGGEGALIPVSDSTTATWGDTVAGGGSNHVLAYCNGTNWTVAAK